MKFCLTILHGQGLETKKALKATYNELVAKKASVKVALAAERASAEHLDDIASFWNEFINEGEPIVRREPEHPALRRKVESEKTYCEKPEIIYEASESSMIKVKSVNESIPDPDRDDLLDAPLLRSNKSMSTEAESNDLQEQQWQQSSKHHHKSKGFKGGCGNNRCGGEDMGRVVISAKPAPVAPPLARAEMC